MLECWQQICQARDALAVSTESQITTLISGRQSVDDFTEVFLKTQSSNLPDRFYLNDADLVILKHASSGQRLMAKVQEYKRKGETTTITLRVYLSHIMHNLNSLLVPRSQWQLSRLVSLSTLHREYAALKSLPYLHLCPDIIGARLPLAQNIDTVARDKIMRIYRTNEPQATAILQASQAKGFSLIQGSVCAYCRAVLSADRIRQTSWYRQV